MSYRLPPLNGLRAFEATARHMSFTRAGRRELHVTPAALSYQVRQLEEILSVKLFKRLNRAIELTPQGQALFPGIRAGFERMDEAMRTLRRRTETNILVVSVGPAFAAKWLAPRLYRFIQRHPDIDPRISANLQISDFENEQIDLAVRFGTGAYPNLHSERLISDYVTPLCSPDLVADSHEHPLREPADLAHHVLIHDESLILLFRQCAELADLVRGRRPDQHQPGWRSALHAGRSRSGCGGGRRRGGAGPDRAGPFRSEVRPLGAPVRPQDPHRLQLLCGEPHGHQG